MKKVKTKKVARKSVSPVEVTATLTPGEYNEDYHKGYKAGFAAGLISAANSNHSFRGPLTAEDIEFIDVFPSRTRNG